jgi:hypothetical protein
MGQYHHPVCIEAQEGLSPNGMDCGVKEGEQGFMAGDRRCRNIGREAAAIVSLRRAAPAALPRRPRRAGRSAACRIRPRCEAECSLRGYFGRLRDRPIARGGSRWWDRDGAQRASRQLLGVAQVGPILIAAERDCNSCGVGACGSTDTVNVFFRVHSAIRN